MATLNFDIQHFESLLQHMLQPNTEVVRNAVNVLNKLLGNSKSIPPLMQLLQTHPQAEIRQLSAVVLRKRIAGHWGKLPAEFREGAKGALLFLMGTDPSIPVRRSTSHVVGVVARVTLATGTWEHLVPALLQLSSAQAPEHRDVALGLLSTLTESISEHLRPYLATIYTLLHTTLQDPVPKIRMSAMKTVGALVPSLETEEEVVKFRELIPLMVETIKNFVTSGLDEEASAAFEVFDELVETPVPVLKPSIPALVRFVLEIGAARQVPLSIRQSAMAFIQTVVHAQKREIVKNKLIGPILAVAIPMCAEPDVSNNNNDDDMDEGRLTAHKFASQLIDFMANILPTKLVFMPVLEYVKQYSVGDAHQRRAAITILAVLSEGCAELMKDDLDVVLPCVLGGFSDAEIKVREAACVAMGQFADFLQPDIIERHAQVLPNLFNGLNDPSAEVVMKCCYALEAYCENMEKAAIELYLPQLMTRLVEVLGKASIETQELAISAISAAAVAAGASFEPYFGALYGMMQGAMQLTDKTQLILRARATECIGLAIQAVGPSAKRFVPEVMTMALTGLQLDFAELKEFTFGFFSNIAEAVTADFAEYLPAVMPHLWTSCDSSDGITAVKPTDDGYEGLEEDEEDDDDVNLSIRTSFLDEKSSAAHTIGVMATSTGAAFLPYVDRSLQSLNQLVRYFHEDVRCAVLLSMQCIGNTINLCYPPPAPWVKGNVNTPLSDQAKQYVDMVLPLFFYSFMTDKIPDVAMQACDSVTETVKTFGPAAINSHMHILSQGLLAVWKRAAPCQKDLDEDDYDDDEDEDAEDIEEDGGDYDEEGEEDEEDGDDHDLDLLDGASECGIELAGALGPLFLQYFTMMVPHILKHTRASNHHTFRALGYGNIAEVIKRMAVDLSSHACISKLIPAVFKGLADGASDVQRTAAYLSGVLLQHTAPLHNSTNSQNTINIQQILAALHPLFDSKRAPVVIDNACGAVARLISISPQAVPLQHVLPVLLSALPLREDHEEDIPVWGCISHLVATSPQSIAPFSAQYLLAATAAVRSRPTEPLAVEVARSVCVFSEFLGAQLNTIAATLPPDAQQTLREIIVNKS